MVLKQLHFVKLLILVRNIGNLLVAGPVTKFRLDHCSSTCGVAKSCMGCHSRKSGKSKKHTSIKIQKISCSFFNNLSNRASVFETQITK